MKSKKKSPDYGVRYLSKCAIKLQCKSDNDHYALLRIIIVGWVCIFIGLEPTYIF